MDEKKRCSHVGFWVVIILLGFGLMLSLVIGAGLFAALVAASGTSHPGTAEDEFPKLTAKWSYGTGEVKVVRIPVRGVIFREAEEGLFGLPYDKIEAILRQIRAARQDKDVKAIILEVDSPGGDMTASDQIYKALSDFKKSADGRKIVTSIGNLGASGGYYVAMPSDWIIAEPTSLIGSIGVILQTLNWKGLGEKIGVTDTTIKSGPNKDLLNPFHDVPPEQLALLQEVTDTLYQRFFGIVQTARGISAPDLQAIADGRIFTSDAALEHRLIDQVGYWEDAVAKTAELLGQPAIKIIRYESKPTFFELLAQVRTPLNFSGLAGAGVPRLMYLWKP
jgi:protease IV